MYFKKYDVVFFEFMKIDFVEEVEEVGKLFGYLLMLKSWWDVYDGCGNVVVEFREVLFLVILFLGGIEWCFYVEKWVLFVKELVIMVVRGRDGFICFFLVVEIIYVSNICYIVEVLVCIFKEVVELVM